MYVPVVLAKGLCPDQLSSFISQQYRWCAGSMSLLRDKSFHDSPLTYRQRMCFFTGFGYYISTAVGVFMLPMPTIIMLWFLPGPRSAVELLLAHPDIRAVPVHRDDAQDRMVARRHLRVYTISSFSHAAAIWHTLIGRTAEWVPTGETRRTSMTSTVASLIVVWTSSDERPDDRRLCPVPVAGPESDRHRARVRHLAARQLHLGADRLACVHRAARSPSPGGAGGKSECIRRPERAGRRVTQTATAIGTARQLDP